MSAARDAAERLRALTALGSTLIVEAAAGTGKTALLAGRLTLLLAEGVPPSAIAAITFSELAAGELAARVREYVDALLGGRTPDVLREVLLSGLTPDGRANLERAAARLDELTASTIHAFCQTILRDHAVSVGMDPGVEVLDAEAADAAFAGVFETWLRARYEAVAAGDDVVAILSATDPRGVAAMLRGLADLRRAHRSARPPAADLAGRPDIDLVEAVIAFRRWSAGVTPEDVTLEALDDLETLVDFYAGTFATPPGFADLWRLAHPPRVSIMERDSYELVAPRRRKAWLRLAGPVHGTRCADEADAHFAAARACYATLLGRVARALVATVSADIDGVLDAWDAFKRAAAVVDFDDLVEAARAIVRDREDVRHAVSQRFRHLLVDEFQDTDLAQAEILFRIAAEGPPDRWQDAEPRPGALFLVGDPKQSIYGFRGADARSYAAAKEALLRSSPHALVQLTANFRCRPAICAHVDACFALPFSEPGQAPYAPLVPTRPSDPHAPPGVSKLSLKIGRSAKAIAIREAEAAAVADLCVGLIGALWIDDDQTGRRLLRASDIAMLTPLGTDLWRYERALGRRGLSVASQAGKGFYLRQEVQDLIALTRILADARDTLAFGALMRGPLVGLTDEAMLDVAEALYERYGEDHRARFTVATDPDDVEDAVARGVLTTLRTLRRRARATTPLQLLSEAVAALRVRAIVAARSREAAPNALANVDAFLDMASGYAVRGLHRFVQDLDAGWKIRASRAEGRADPEADCVEIATIHGAKGSEWPVVIPINTISRLGARRPFFHRSSDDTIHWSIGDVVAPGLAAAVEEIREKRLQESRRVWYVAATRGRDLVVVPDVSMAPEATWAKVLDLDLDRLPEFDPAWLRQPTSVASEPINNAQDAATFAEQGATIKAATPALSWLRPSRHDGDRLPEAASDLTVAETGEALATEVVGAGRLRGLVIHKLFEEILTGECVDELDDLSTRAAELLRQMGAFGKGGVFPDADEMARTVISGLSLPEIARMRPGLVPEVAVRAMLRDGTDWRPLDGRADAVFLDSGGGMVVIDWKSNVDPAGQDAALHVDQLRSYLAATGAQRGAIVYVTTGFIRWVS